MTESTLIVLLIFAVIYLLPTYIAIRRGHHNAGAIAAANILFGWTFIGWAVALVWAMTSVK